VCPNRGSDDCLSICIARLPLQHHSMRPVGIMPVKCSPPQARPALMLLQLLQVQLGAVVLLTHGLSLGADAALFSCDAPGAEAGGHRLHPGTIRIQVDMRACRLQCCSSHGPRLLASSTNGWCRGARTCIAEGNGVGSVPFGMRHRAFGAPLFGSHPHSSARAPLQ
jgi:hypothetical protein